MLSRLFSVPHTQDIYDRNELRPSTTNHTGRGDWGLSWTAVKQVLVRLAVARLDAPAPVVASDARSANRINLRHVFFARRTVNKPSHVTPIEHGWAHLNLSSPFVSDYASLKWVERSRE